MSTDKIAGSDAVLGALLDTSPKNAPLSPVPEAKTLEEPLVDVQLLSAQRQNVIEPSPVARVAGPTYTVRDRRSFCRDPYKLLIYLIPFPESKQTSDGTDAVALRRFLLYTPGLPRNKRNLKDKPVRTRLDKSDSATIRGLNRLKRYRDFMRSDSKFIRRASRTVKRSRKVSKKQRHNSSIGGNPEEIVIFYPASLPASPETIEKEFLNSIARIKHRAKKHAWFGIGLLPVAILVEVALVVGTANHMWSMLMPIDLMLAMRSVNRGIRASRVSKSLVASKISDVKIPKIIPCANAEMNTVEEHLAALCDERKRLRTGIDIPKLMKPADFDISQAIESTLTEVAGIETGDHEEWEMWEVKEDLLKALEAGSNKWDMYTTYIQIDHSRSFKKQ